MQLPFFHPFCFLLLPASFSYLLLLLALATSFLHPYFILRLFLSLALAACWFALAACFLLLSAFSIFLLPLATSCSSNLLSSSLSFLACFLLLSASFSCLLLLLVTAMLLVIVSLTRSPVPSTGVGGLYKYQICASCMDMVTCWTQRVHIGEGSVRVPRILAGQRKHSVLRRCCALLRLIHQDARVCRGWWKLVSSTSILWFGCWHLLTVWFFSRYAKPPFCLFLSDLALKSFPAIRQISRQNNLIHEFLWTPRQPRHTE